VTWGSATARLAHFLTHTSTSCLLVANGTTALYLAYIGAKKAEIEQIRHVKSDLR